MPRPADKFDKVTPRDPLSIPAQTYNALIDLLKSHQQHRHQNPRDIAAWGKMQRQPCVVLLKNDSGSDRDRFAALSIDASVPITPTDNLEEFQDRVLLIGKLPDIAVDFGRIAILIEPILQGGFGEALLLGTTPHQVKIVHEDHQWADIDDGEVALKTAPTGAAHILWKEPGVAAGSLAWAFLDLVGPPQDRVILCTVETDGGTAGDETTDCDFTYAVQVEGNEVATLATPLRPRYPLTTYIVAPSGSYGLGLWDYSGESKEFKLLVAFGEIEDTQECVSA